MQLKRLREIKSNKKRKIKMQSILSLERKAKMMNKKMIRKKKKRRIRMKIRKIKIDLKNKKGFSLNMD